jgi:hypothetical protein
MNPLRLNQIALFSAAFLLSLSCHGWGPGGHMVIAKIAHDRLNTKAKAEADRLLAIAINPVGLSSRTADFVTASHWADDVRPLASFSHTADYHFIDNPFAQDGSELPDDLPKAENVVRALQDYVETLKTSNDDQEKAQALRFIIHFVGDIHQPLHCSSRVSANLLEGDQGGNKYMISERDEQGTKHRVKLHSFWDGAIETLPKMRANFQPPPVSEAVAFADDLVLKFPDTGCDTSDPFAFEKWAQESFDLAKSDVYKGITQGKEVSIAYRTRTTPIAQKRVAWAAYRLATLLNAVWPVNP